ncbi:MAG: Antitoxin component YafN of the YafNO toxin-antitoxin module, PHD/YefM family [Chloroflexi bacterium]|nr:MAG: Antitoxin component YafN of the YafNO toxin-antitoxin module, PHD/YefM family [Chloroflexota bacterium]
MVDARKRPLQVIVENGEPAAVVVPIDEYEEMIERLEDAEDIEELARLRAGPRSSRKLEEFLAEYSPGV